MSVTEKSCCQLNKNNNETNGVFATHDQDLFRNNLSFLRGSKLTEEAWLEATHLPELELAPELSEGLVQAEHTVGAITRIAAKFAESGWLHVETLHQARLRLDRAHNANSLFLVSAADLHGTPRQALARLVVAGMVLNYLEDLAGKDKRGLPEQSSQNMGNLAVAMRRR